MSNKIAIIYIEGKENPQPKQEKNLFQSSQSARFWAKYFSHNDYCEYKFIIIPKHYESNERWNQYKNIISSRIKSMYKSSNFYLKDSEIELDIIITGDHDEVKDPSLIRKTKEKATELKNIFISQAKNCVILLEKSKSFKIEKLMSELCGGIKINKKILKTKCEIEYPTIEELMNGFKIKSDKFLLNLSESEHPLFIWINKNKSNK